MSRGSSRCFQLVHFHRNCLRTFRYSCSLTERVIKLVQVITNKDLSLNEATRSLKVAWKQNEELEKALNESQDSQQKTKVDLTNMSEANFSLLRSCPNSCKKDFMWPRTLLKMLFGKFNIFIRHVSFLDPKFVLTR